MITMTAFIAIAILLIIIFLGGTGFNMLLNRGQIKKYGVQARRPKQPHLHDIIFVRSY
jgi:hypothetical protein